MKRPLIRARWLVFGAACVLIGCATGGQPKARAFNDGASIGWQQDAFALSTKADRAYRDGRWADAVRHYEALTKRVPDDAYAWFRLANTHARQGAYERAVVAYQRSVERNAADPRAWFNLSTAYLVSAQRAMTRSWESMRPGDPARALIEARLRDLGELMQSRIQDAHAWQSHDTSR